MLCSISKIYEVPFSKDRGKSILSTLLGGVIPDAMARGLVGSLIKAVPIVGPFAGMATMPVFSGASTYAVSRVFIQHFESGGTFLDFEPEKVKEYFAEIYKQGEDFVSKKGSKTSQATA